MHRFDFHETGPVSENVELSGRGVGKIDQTVVQEWPAVIDSDHHRAVVLQIAHTHVRWQWQRSVGRRHGVHVVGFAARCTLPVKFFSVPGSDPAFAVPTCFGDGRVGCTVYHVGFVTGGRTRLGFRHCVRNFFDLRRRMGPGAIVFVITAGRGERPATRQQRLKRYQNNPA